MTGVQDAGVLSHTDAGMLSSTQESLWLFHELAGSDEPAYNESLAFDIVGTLEPDAIRRAVHAAVLRHEALRTTFHETPEGPRARVLDPVAQAVPDSTTLVDLRADDAGTARARADELLAEHHQRPFDLGTAPLLRTLLLALPGERWVLALTAHHIVIDDWSLRLVLDEIAEDYRELAAGRAAPQRPVSGAAFRAFAATDRAAAATPEHAAKVERWRRSLADCPELLGMPLDRPRPAAQTFRGDSLSITVPRAEVEPLLRACARACRSTAFPVFLAAYAVLLRRYTRQDGFAVGTTVLNRPGSADLDEVGCYVNTLPLFVPVGEDDTFREVLGAAQQAAGRLLDDGDTPFAAVVEAIGGERPRNHNPVFQTMLTMLGDEPAIDLGPELACVYRPVRRTAAKFDLVLYVSPADDAYRLELEFNTDLFTRDTAERIVLNYAQLLRSLAAASLDTPVSALSMTRDEERRLLLQDWNDTAVRFPDGTVVDVIEEQVRRTPHALAVEFDGEQYTYDMLNRRANRVAARIRRELRGSGAGPFVGVYMERSLELVVALLAIVKAGYAYVPIDPEYPAARIEFMIRDADLPLILTQHKHRGGLGDAAARVLVLPDPDHGQDGNQDGGQDTHDGREAGAARDADEANPVRELGPDSPVYMIYTSGSTGQPKGVINRHEALANRLHWMQSAFPLTGATDPAGGGDRVLQKTPYSFDVSVWEFFWPLMFGAAVVVAQPGGHRDPDYLKELIASSSVTTVHFVPSMLNVFLEAEKLADACVSLKRVVCSGEALPRKSIEVFHDTLPGCELHNLYGPTEAAIDVSHWPCTPDYPGELVPIGKPIANVRLYVLDARLRLQPVGVPGELCVGGVAVAAGYHRRDDLSAKVFVTDPYATGTGAPRLYRTGDLARFLPDGQIQYLGRIDSQVKLRGLRVEPDEIAAVLRELPGVQDAAVVVDASGPAPALAAYVVGPGCDTDDLRARLGTLLPEYLVPQYLLELPHLPTTANGKLDRRALPAPSAAAAPAARAGRPLTTAAQRDVARAWREVLAVAGEVGADSNFFALGGDSIMALRVASRLRAAGYTAGLREVFGHATVAELAASLTRRPGADADRALPPFALVDEDDRALLPPAAEDAWPLTRLQSGMIYHSLLDEDSPVYHDIFDYEFAGPADLAALAGAIGDVAARHPHLRSYFDLETFGEPLQIVLGARSAQVTPTLESTDVSALPGDAQDRAIEDWIEAEKRRPLDLGRPPVRFRVHVRAADRFNLALSFHHLLLDGWSVALVVAQIRQRYAGRLAGREPDTARPAAAPEPGYGTYVALERDSARRPADQAAWRALLDGFPATLVAGGPAAAPGDGVRTAVVERVVPAALEAGLRRRAAGLGLPLKSLYLAAHCAALARLSGSPRVIAGLVGNGRPEIAGGTEMVGLFLNTLPFPIEVPDADDLALPAAVLRRERELIALQRFPLADIERQHGGALFDVVFNFTDFHTYAEEDAAGAGARVSIVSARYFELTNFPVILHAHWDHFAGEMQLAVCHAPERVATATAERFLTGVLAALERYAADEPAGEATDGNELSVAAVIARAVGRDALDATENYLDAGVDSITSIRILVKLRKLFPAAALRDVMEARTVRALVRRLTEPAQEVQAARSARTPATAVPRESTAPAAELPDGVLDAYPLTATQHRMIEATRRDPGQSAYHDVFAYDVALPLDEDLLRAALRRTVARHETLRTSFDLDGPLAPRQLVHDRVEPELTVVTTLDTAGDAAGAWFDAERGSGFAWERPGLIRFAAHRSAGDAFVLSLSFHHAVIDGWSLSLLMRDLLLSYAGALDGTGDRGDARQEQAALPFRAYVAAERDARVSAASRDFWRGVLDGHPGTSLPRYRADESREGRHSRWSGATVTVGPEQESRLRAIARDTGVPLKHWLLAAHLRVLTLLTGEPDVVTGVFTHGRPETDDADALVGMFLTFQPHRARVLDQTWPELAEQVFAFEMSALAHRRCAATAAGDEGGRPRWPALFNYTEFPAYADVARERPLLTGVRWFEHTDAPFLATVGRDPAISTLEITLDADARLLPQGVLDEVAGLYAAVLAQIAADPAGPVRRTTKAVRTRTTALSARQHHPSGSKESEHHL